MLGARGIREVTLLNESFVLYRDDEGTPRLLAARCAHRNARLAFGRVEAGGIRCRYHGWKYAASGQCIEQPGEAECFAAKVQLGAFPVTERLGVIFAYVGPGAPPPIPWPEWEGSTTDVPVVFHVLRRCNYLQALENIFDDVHLSTLHRGTYFDAVVPSVSAEERPYGFISRSVHVPTGKYRSQLFIVPNSVFILNAVSSQTGRDTLLWIVPRDDVSSDFFISTRARRDSGLAGLLAARDRVNTFPMDAAVAAIVAGERSLDDLDPRQPETFHIEDRVMLESQGPIHDRRHERLGASDRSIIVLRRLLTREVGALANGLPLTPFSPPENFREALEGGVGPDQAAKASSS
jgi:5,5'-dehydrodivanillate O-demethylase